MTQTASDAVPPIPSRRGVRRRIWRAVKILAVLYVVACTIMFFLQTTIIYPGSWTQGQTETVLPASIRQDVIRLRGRDGVSIVGLFGGAQSEDGQAMEDTSHCPTIIYFYGNGSCLADSTQQFEDFRRLGANVIMADYEGYGMSGGKASETGCYDTADAEYDYLRGRGDIDMSRIVPIGWSLGGAVAIDLASRRPVAGIVTISTFTTMQAMARKVAPWLPGPVLWLLLRSRFDSIDKLRGISAPILIMHGSRDELIPAWMSPALAAAAKERVTQYTIDGAEHNDVLQVGGEGLLEQTDGFMDQVFAGGRQGEPTGR